ncbi:hydroxyacid dehydrogenase [SAR202 cluster bacterium AD-804-J14_MRT_500m]|nr:hydroxyacid dehydrogenase [SAR202 cluster bacterium AD-804-J14_MRT_500m]
MKALVLAPFSPYALSQLRGMMEVSYESWTNTRTLHDPTELGRRLNDESIDILLTEADFIFEELFENAPRLKFVGICRNELGHVDISAASKNGVLVVNTPGRNANAVAEITLGFMLALARRIPSLDAYVKFGKWEDPVAPYLSFRGIELRTNILGIVGLGRIGKSVAKIARSLGMEVLAFDPYAGALGQRIDGALLTDLDSVVKQSTFLSLNAPRSEETTGLISDNHLASMPSGSFLINTSFYEIVDESSLVNRLNCGPLAGAAFDVHPAHPVPPSSPLLKLNNVILTPHIGGATNETIERHSNMIVTDLRRYLRGYKPNNLVNPDVWQMYDH